MLARLHRATQKRASVWGSPYMCPLPPLITHCITWRRLCPTRAYIRVNLLHPQGAIHFSYHFLQSLPLFHYWLERRSANLPVGTFRSRNCHRHTGVLSTTVVTHPFSPDRSFGARRMASFTKCHGLMILHCNRFFYALFHCNRFNYTFIHHNGWQLLLLSPK